LISNPDNLGAAIACNEMFSLFHQGRIDVIRSTTTTGVSPNLKVIHSRVHLLKVFERDKLCRSRWCFRIRAVGIIFGTKVRVGQDGIGFFDESYIDGL